MSEQTEIIVEPNIRPITVLRVPAHDANAVIIGAAAAAALQAAGSSESRANEARCVIEALSVDAISRCGEGPDPDPWIELKIEVRTGGVRLKLHDRGLPIASDRTAIRRAKQLAAAGCVDQLSVVGVSPDGPTATVFVKTVDPRRESSADRTVENEPSETVELAPTDEQLRIRRMVPGDSAAYARLTFRCYGYGYKRAAYDPADIDGHLQDGTQLAAIAENTEGEMVGHVAYQRIRPGGSVVHAGAGMVDPRYRKRGLLKALGASVHEMIASENLIGILSEPVMVHTVTQRAAHSIGFDTGIFLNWSNPRFVAGFEDADPTQRISVLCSFIPLSEITPRDLFPPPSAIKHLQTVVETTNIPRTIREPQRPANETTETVVMAHTDPGTGIAQLEVTTVGPDLIDRIIELLDDALAGGSPVVILDLPANEPSLGWCAAGIDQLGFVFAALLPESAADGDTLRLQYVVDLDIDSSEWKIDLPSTIGLVSGIVDDLHTWHDGQARTRRTRIEQWRSRALEH